MEKARLTTNVCSKARPQKWKMIIIRHWAVLIALAIVIQLAALLLFELSAHRQAAALSLLDRAGPKGVAAVYDFESPIGVEWWSLDLALSRIRSKLSGIIGKDRAGYVVGVTSRNGD